ncbi:MAG: methionyl-tRNA formyltransferase [Candidatus Levybacteria bacterium]|nr:methionyl-tRNA formyltransferase [Candidatus Levybacteria bacterium]
MLRIVFFGTPSFVIPILKILAENFTVIGVVTSSDALVGRKKILTPSPVKQFALANQIPVFTLKSLEIRNLTLEIPDVDLFVVAAYGKLIPKEILNIPRLGAINIHPSLLPKYRGPSPIQTAILNGDKKTGITFIKIDEQVDHGPILAQYKLPINPDDTSEALHTKLFTTAASFLTGIITDYYSNKLEQKSQNNARATFCDKVKKEDGYFDIDNPPPPEKLDRMIRAYFPWPAAWTRVHLGGGRMDSFEVKKNSEVKIVKFLPGKKLQIEGGKVMGYRDFINGYPELKEKIDKLKIY